MSDLTPSYGVTLLLAKIMKRFLLSLLLLCSLTSLASAADKNTALIHPGETVYVRFETQGKKIKFASASKEKDDAAQIIFTWAKEFNKNGMRQLKVENKFASDLVYKVEIRSLTQKHEARFSPSPVVAGKIGFDEYPIFVEEIAAFDFKLER
jgi:hypothetical protein